MCCGDEIIDAAIEKEKDLKKECFKEVMALTKEEKSSAVTDPFSCEKITKVKKEWTVSTLTIYLLLINNFNPIGIKLNYPKHMYLAQIHCKYPYFKTNSLLISMSYRFN